MLEGNKAIHTVRAQYVFYVGKYAILITVTVEWEVADDGVQICV
jgi:hypothetical protein